MLNINDLNLKNWKEKIITMYGDKYKIRKTYDIDDFLGLGICGYEINDEQGNYLFYHQEYNEMVAKLLLLQFAIFSQCFVKLRKMIFVVMLLRLKSFYLFSSP